ncbi:MAG: hypothetical protein JWO87_19 [Phycisphaerales bacterium]|nr:hypothetical protein [Phycisphaerales bacterium]
MLYRGIAGRCFVLREVIALNVALLFQQRRFACYRTLLCNNRGSGPPGVGPIAPPTRVKVSHLLI